VVISGGADSFLHYFYSIWLAFYNITVYHIAPPPLFLTPVKGEMEAFISLLPFYDWETGYGDPLFYGDNHEFSFPR